MAKKKALPVVSVIDRRLQHPFGAPSVPITMKDGQQWETRWMSGELRSGRVHQALKMGWAYVLPEEIDGSIEELGFDVKDNRIVQGHHGQEVLMKMPRADYARLQQAKADKNLRDMRGEAIKSNVAQRTAAKFGDEAADSVYNSDIEVKDSRVNIDLDGDSA
jgi:hypothetical protein